MTVAMANIIRLDVQPYTKKNKLRNCIILLQFRVC